MPYNPGTSSQAGYLIGQGLSQAGASVGAGIERYLNRKREQEEEDKRRAKEYDALVKYGEATGIISKDRAITMSLDELSGHIKGTVAKQETESRRLADEKARHDIRRSEAEMASIPIRDEFMRAQTTQMQAAGTRNDAVARWAEAFASGQGAPTGFAPTAAFPPALVARYAPMGMNERFLNATRIAPGAISPEVVMDYLKATAPAGAPNEFAIGSIGRPMETGLPGHYVVPTSTRSAQLVPKPETEVKALPVKVGDEVMGYQVGNRFITKNDMEGVPQDAKISQAVDDKGNPVPGVYRWTAGSKFGWIRPPAENPLMRILADRYGGGVPGVPAQASNPNDPLQLFP